MREFEDLLILVCRYFDDRNIDYTVRGGVAVIFQGRFRTTEDIDFIVSQENFNNQEFGEFCQLHELSLDPYDLEEGKKDRSQISVMDFQNSIRLDLKFAFSDWEKGAITNSEEFEYKGQKISVCGPEHLIMNKIYKSGRIDIEDAYSVYFQNKSRLKIELMHQLAKYFKIEKEFEIFLKNDKKAIKKNLNDF